ncbi:uncharacterized protein LOC129909173 [Episyrphus balteatus]|uniref:uncharacterized protein LOC129909173 n=1 Tax=Episyrphus balteatus TaxID=286459 RepID=UPI00248574AC|nr:uncharacterized protein LOC129909173 [Episyrphus balteatus]
MPQSSNNTTLISNISRKDRTKISRDYKKIKCLDTLAKKYQCTIDQIQMIVNEKKKKKTNTPATVETNSHLVSLLDKVVYEWFQRAQRLIETGTITEEMFLQKAHETSQIFGIQNLIPDHEWVRNFRKKYNITNLDMTMLRIDNNSKPLSADIKEVVMHVLENNPITEYFTTNSNLHQNTAESTTSLVAVSPNQDDRSRIQYTNYESNSEIITSDNMEIPADVQIEVLPPSGAVIRNDEEARQHLKPLEEYVLLKENFRAIGLISQLEEIFASETNNFQQGE